jgi:hypothetical protein
LTSILAGKGFVREYDGAGGAAKVAVASVIAAFSGELRLPQMFARHFQSRASRNFYCVLWSIGLLRRFRLFEK